MSEIETTTRRVQGHNLSDDIGSFTALFEKRSFEIKQSARWRGDSDKRRKVDEIEKGEKFDILRGERRAGVYLPSRKVGGDLTESKGTVVQNNVDVLQAAVEEATEVALKAHRDGYPVFGVGKNHDNTLTIYVESDPYDESPRFKGKEYCDGSPFRDATIMYLPAQWWTSVGKNPSLRWKAGDPRG